MVVAIILLDLVLDGSRCFGRFPVSQRSTRRPKLAFASIIPWLVYFAVGARVFHWLRHVICFRTVPPPLGSLEVQLSTVLPVAFPGRLRGGADVGVQELAVFAPPTAPTALGAICFVVVAQAGVRVKAVSAFPSVLTPSLPVEPAYGCRIFVIWLFVLLLLKVWRFICFGLRFLFLRAILSTVTLDVRPIQRRVVIGRGELFIIVAVLPPVCFYSCGLVRHLFIELRFFFLAGAQDESQLLVEIIC